MPRSSTKSPQKKKRVRARILSTLVVHKITITIKYSKTTFMGIQIMINTMANKSSRLMRRECTSFKRRTKPSLMGLVWLKAAT